MIEIKKKFLHYITNPSVNKYSTWIFFNKIPLTENAENAR